MAWPTLVGSWPWVDFSIKKIRSLELTWAPTSKPYLRRRKEAIFVDATFLQKILQVEQQLEHDQFQDIWSAETCSCQQGLSQACTWH